MKHIFFTGGGSGGHVIPALTIIKRLLDNPEVKVSYIGSYDGIERTLTREININYKAILSGKLRRYFSWQNFLDVFKVILAIFQVFWYLLFNKKKESVLISMGGFVSVPVVVAAWVLRIPIYIHEQTSRIGLANKIASRFASKIFISFKESQSYFPANKTIFTGYPVRDECYDMEVRNSELKGRQLSKISRPILFVTGGGNGSYLLNSFVEDNLSKLKKEYFIIHQVGKNNIHKYEKFEDENYLALDFATNPIDLIKLACIVISRAGAGTVSELLAMRIPSLYIPLKIAQKNEQYHNAMEAKKILGSVVVEEVDLYKIDLIKELKELRDIPANKVQNIKDKALDNIIGQIFS